MKKRRRILAMFLTGILTLGLTGCGLGSGPQKAPESAAAGESEAAGGGSESAETVTIRFGHSGTEDHQYQVFAAKFKELVEEQSGGRLAVEIFPNAILGNDREMIESMLMGQLEMFVGSSTTSWVPETAITDMPFLYRDYEHAYSCYDGFLFDELGSRFEENGMTLLGYVSIGWRNISNNVRPINSVEDLQGLKIRVPDMEVYAATFEAMGATTVTVSLNELYMALQQSVADGQDNPASTFWAQSFQEVQDYLTLTHHMLGTNFVLVNSSWLGGLPQEDQDLIRSAAKEAQDYQREYLSGVEDELVEQIREAGVEVNEPADLQSFIDACSQVPEELGVVPQEWLDQIRGM